MPVKYKRQSVGDYFSKNTCQIFLTPYNAHPLTGNKPTQSAMDTESAARDSEKNKQKKSLTLDEESVIYATSRQRPKLIKTESNFKRNVAPLFNNLSDNLCG
ncbi:TPA: hypothetical protein ACS70J_002802, partial [Providencia alcalifaciens]